MNSQGDNKIQENRNQTKKEDNQTYQCLLSRWVVDFFLYLPIVLYIIFAVGFSIIILLNIKFLSEISSLWKFIIFLIIAVLGIPRLHLFTNISNFFIIRKRRLCICVQAKYIRTFNISIRPEYPIRREKLCQEIQNLYRQNTYLKILIPVIIVLSLLLAFYTNPILSP